MPHPKGPLETPRNQLIYRLKREGMSYNKIAVELYKNGFEISAQRIQHIVKQKAVADAEKQARN